MPKPARNDTSFKSSLPGAEVAAYFYTETAEPPFCVLQISHGMCEYIARYEEFIHFLNQNGVVVCGNDHLGHGATAKKQEDYGFFGTLGGRLHVLNDLKTMNAMAHGAYPDLPVVLLGHSMGSFYARKYAVRWPDSISALIISGTGGPNPLAGMGITAAKLAARIKGPGHRSAFVHNLAFGAYLKRIENPRTPYDWVSRDEEVVRQYNLDPQCNFRFTVNGFHELFSALRDVSGPDWAAAMPKDLPVLMIQGGDDPVGDYGAGTEKVRQMLQQAGVQKLDYILYPGMRHEVLNEIGREQVYTDVLAFLKQV